MASAAESRIVVCNRCGQKNRLTTGMHGRTPVCGRCGRELNVASAAPVVLTDDNFASVTGDAARPVLIDMWAAWCGPCRMLAPVIDQLAAELAGRVVVAKLDVDANPLTAARFGVQSIPTLLILKNGGEVDRIVGVQPKGSIIKRLQPFI